MAVRPFVFDRGVPQNAGRKRAIRRFWLLLHRWLGLAGLLIIVLFGLTGSILVFRNEIDALLYPSLHYSRAPDNRAATIDRVVSNIQAAYPDGTLVALNLPGARRHAPPETYMAWVREADRRSYIFVYVDPVDGRVLGARRQMSDPMWWLWTLHYAAAMPGPDGRLIIGLLGFVMLFSLISGMVLFWPMLKRGKGLWFRRGVGPRKRWYDLHVVANLWFWPFLMLITLSGIAINLPKEAEWVVARFVDVPPPRKAPPISPPPHPVRLPLQTLYEAALAARGDGRPASISVPTRPDQPFQLSLVFPGDQSPWASGAIWLDPYTGAVLGARDPRYTPASRRLLSEWLLPVHDGSILGLPGRLLVLLAGLVPLLAAVSGVAWWRAKRSR